MRLGEGDRVVAFAAVEHEEEPEEETGEVGPVDETAEENMTEEETGETAEDSGDDTEI